VSPGTTTRKARAPCIRRQSGLPGPFLPLSVYVVDFSQTSSPMPICCARTRNGLRYIHSTTPCLCEIKQPLDESGAKCLSLSCEKAEEKQSAFLSSVTGGRSQAV